MSRTGTQIRKWAILFHRWMGVAFCVLFLVWFASGIVMMYWGYPKVSVAHRLSHLPALDPSTIRVSPEEAYARLSTSDRPTQVRVSILDGRPAYRFAFGAKRATVFADDGQRLDSIPQDMALRVASHWTGLSASGANFDGFITDAEIDQWSVNPSVRPYGPFWKYSWPDGQEVYVSQPSGDIAQHTTRGSRLGAWLGAVPHWIYFTALRKDPLMWNRVVTWSSGIGTVMSLLGVIVGLWMYSPSKRYRFPAGASSIPYAGQKRWHTILGLIFGLVTCTWIFSGMMSMSPLPVIKETVKGDVIAALRGEPVAIAAYSLRHPREAIAAAGLPVKELDLVSFAGEPFYLATEAHERSRIVPMQADVVEMLPQNRILDLIAKASPIPPAEVRTVTSQEAYYVDRRHERPFPVLFLRFHDPQESMYYIDPRTGRVVQSYTANSRWNRWLYNGMHSLDFPWLYTYRPAWDIVVMILMLGGTALCVTSVVIGWRRLKRKAVMIRQPSRPVRKPEVVLGR